MADPFAPLPETFGEDDPVSSPPWHALDAPTSTTVISARNRCEMLYGSLTTNRKAADEMAARVQIVLDKGAEAREAFTKALASKNSEEISAARTRHAKLSNEFNTMQAELDAADAGVQGMEDLLNNAIVDWQQACEAAKASAVKEKTPLGALSISDSPRVIRNKRERGQSTSDTVETARARPTPRIGKGKAREVEEEVASRVEVASPVKKGKDKVKDDYSTVPGARPAQRPCDTCTLAKIECYTTAALDSATPAVCLHCKKSRRGCSRVLRESPLSFATFVPIGVILQLWERLWPN
jgi:hypothetical protein